MSLREELIALLGNWSGTEQLTPLDGPVTTARAMLVAKLDVADRVVLLDYRQVAAGGAEYSGHGVFTEDRDSADICWWFFDSTGSAPTIARGRRSGNGLVLVADDRPTRRVPVRGGRRRAQLRDPDQRQRPARRLDPERPLPPHLRSLTHLGCSLAHRA